MTDIEPLEHARKNLSKSQFEESARPPMVLFGT